MVNVDEIIAFESGEMTEKQMIKMFQKMVNDGSVWKLQGFYGRTAQAFLDDGKIHYPKKRTHDFYGKPIPTKAEASKIKKVL